MIIIYMSIIRSLFQVNQSISNISDLVVDIQMVPQKFTFELEEDLLKKYSSFKEDKKIRKGGNRKSMAIVCDQKNQNDLIIFDSFKGMDEDNISMLMAICPEIQKRESARFLLEASSYDLEEAEKLFYEQKEERKSKGTYIQIKMIFPDKREIEKKFLNTDSLWEIGAVVFQNTKCAKEFKLVHKETGNEIDVEGLVSMTFQEYGLEGSCTLIVSFVE